MSAYQPVGAARVLRVTISHQAYHGQVGEYALRQVFGRCGVVEEVCVQVVGDEVVARVALHSWQAVRAREAFQDRCMWDGCCWMDIHMSSSFLRPQLWRLPGVRRRASTATSRVLPWSIPLLRLLRHSPSRRRRRQAWRCWQRSRPRLTACSPRRMCPRLHRPRTVRCLVSVLIQVSLPPLS